MRGLTFLLTFTMVCHLFAQDVTDVTDAIDNAPDSYSGTLILNETPDFETNCENRQTVSFMGASHEGSKLIIKEALVQFFNNKTTTVFIQASLISGGEEEKINFLNNRFSIPMRAFNYDGYRLSAKAKNGQNICIDMNDVFDYVNNQFFNYSVADQQYVLKTDEVKNQSAAIVQRRFFDFFTGIIYSDLMGFDTENTNSIINAQAALLVLMNQTNFKKIPELALTRQFRVLINVALSNNFENASRYIGFMDDETVEHFDLFRKNSLNGLLYVDALTYESKGWFLSTSLGYNIGFYRTPFRYTQTMDGTDAVTEGQVISLSHGPYLNFEFRPQTNFGADIYFSFEKLALNDNVVLNERDFNSDILINKFTKGGWFNHNIANLSANFYWLLNPSKSDGGVYARIAGAYHFPTDAVYPQMLVGYATNLSSFVNRFKPKK